jgi:hypothetical protein
MGEKFFRYYGEVFKEGALTAREKSLMLWQYPMLFNARIV